MKGLKIAHFVILGIWAVLWIALSASIVGEPVLLFVCFWALLLGYAAVTTLLAHFRRPLVAIVVHGVALALFILNGWVSLYFLIGLCRFLTGGPPMDF